jgi:hypothetical protein
MPLYVAASKRHPTNSLPDKKLLGPSKIFGFSDAQHMFYTSGYRMVIISINGKLGADRASMWVHPAVTLGMFL